MKRADYVSLGLIVLMFCLGAFFYNSLPEKMASHWDASGEVNGYMGKAQALFLIPALTLVLYGFFLLIPYIDPLQENIAKFRGYYDNFILFLVVFMFYVHGVMILLNLGYNISINVLITPAVAAILFYSGVLMERSKRNWFIGVSTPWTLSSDVVWEKTNRLGGKVFKAFGVIILLALLFPKYMIYIILLLVLGGLGLVLYSYLEYRKLGKSSSESGQKK